MNIVLLRRRKLGRTSCREIVNYLRGMDTDASVVRNWRRGEWPAIVTHVFRWGCTDNVPEGVRVFNSAKAIHEVNDKLGFRRKLNEAGLCPRTWFSHPDVPMEYYDLNIPLIVRPARHAQGRQLHVCQGWDEVGFYSTQKYGAGNYYISRRINKVAEYRVCVVQGRAVWVAKKTPGNPDEVAWNVAKGGRFDNVRWDDWPLKAVKKSVEAFNLSSLDYGGVDVMVDAEGECYILEINSAPSLTSPYRQECTAKAFNWLVRYGKERIPLIQEKGGYKKFIHPAICERAIV